MIKLRTKTRKARFVGLSLTFRFESARYLLTYTLLTSDTRILENVSFYDNIALHLAVLIVK